MEDIWEVGWRTSGRISASSFNADSDCVMASFDFNRLFINVPLIECVGLCCDLLYKYPDLISYNECNFTCEQFRKLFNFAVKNNHFFLTKLKS